MAELDGAGALVSRFVYGSRDNVPDYVLRGGKTYRIVSDYLGSPRVVVNVNDATDVPLAVTWTPFGAELAVQGDIGFLPMGFAGGLYDPETGLVRFGARDYDAVIGRWVSKDPILFDGRQTNLYLYLAGDPINRRDPSGLLSYDDACKISGACREECARLNAWNPIGYINCLAGCVIGGLVWEKRQPYGRYSPPGNDPDCARWASFILAGCLADGHDFSACRGAANAAYWDCISNGTGK